MNTKSFAQFVLLFTLTAFCMSCGGGGDDNDRQVDLTWHKDSDGDGYSDGVARFSSNRPVGYYRQDELIATEGDCDDNNDTVHPEGVEIDGDGLDQDCNGFEIGGPPEVVFDWTTDRCEDLDIPDLPARAFRDAANQVQLISSHHDVRRSIGADLNSIVHECGIVMTSHNDPDPGNFDDYEWIAATYTEDGTTIHAIIHNEFHGYDHPGQCSFGPQYWSDCWYNGLTLAVSTDGGLSYGHPVSPPLHLIASYPVQYELDQGPYGIFAPSNIIKGRDGFYYAVVHLVEPESVHSTCLIRNFDLSDPDSWRFWDGSGFVGVFVNPYTDPIIDPNEHICAAVDKDNISDMHDSLSYNEYLDRYVLVGQSWDGVTHGFYYSLSEDLTSWTPRQLILERNPPWASSGPLDTVYLYPSLLDPDSLSRNFDTSGKTAYIYYTRFNPGSGGLDRDMMRVPIEFFRE